MGVYQLPRRASARHRFQIREGLAGGLLPCGCAFGRYLTYSGAVLTVIDDASECREGHLAELRTGTENRNWNWNWNWRV